MSKTALRFERIEVDRVLGIRRGEGFVLEDLAPGVNLVHGPNGSGKTTTARAIQELLWPGRTKLERPTLSGQLVEGTVRWRVDLDAGSLTCTRDGAPAPAPQASAPEQRDRYRLALHELIAADDAGFARTIVTESQGGFDLAGAAEDLGFRVSGAAGRAESKEVVARRAHAQDARVRQEELELAAAGLAGLRRQREAAAAARRDVEALDRALEHDAAALVSRELAARLAALPPELERLRGDERERLDVQDGQRRKLEQTQGDARLQAEGARREVAGTGLPTGGVDAQVLRELRAVQRRAQDHEAALAHLRRELGEASSDEQETRRRLCTVVPPERLAALQTLRLADLGDLARQADRVRARDAVLEEHRRWLEAHEPASAEGHDEDRLRSGVAALHEWLGSATDGAAPPARSAGVGLVASLALVVLGLVLAAAVHVAWAVASLLGAALVGLELALRRRRAGALPVGTDPRAVHRQSFEATRLPAPERWEAGAVQDCLRALVRALAALEHEKERAKRARELQAERAALVAEQEALAAVKRDVEARLGLELRLDAEWLPLFAETLGRWQRSADALRAAERELARVESERTGLLAQVAAGLAAFGYPAPGEAAVAGANLDDLEARRERRNRAWDQVDELERRVRDEYAPALERLSAERAALLARVGLQAGQEDVLDGWLALLPERGRLVRGLAEQEALRDGHARALAGRPELLVLDRAELQASRVRAEELAGRLEALVHEIGSVEARVEDAKLGFDLTDALAALGEAEERLETARDKSAQAAVGAAIVDWVRTTALERSRPQVFRRAQELLLAFTRGALVLELDDQTAEPRFLARQGQEAPRPVDQLSVGERVQLLIAVRLAFLEQDETVRLPLLLDEALGTSDDARAGAIIEAVKALAASGRQVFYFTAQHDEVGKWRAALGAELPHRIYDLAELRRLPGRGGAPLPVSAVPRPVVPAPDGLDYAAYGARLGVRALDPRTPRLDGLHLWHVLDDAATLHRLLDLGVVTWGQLRALLEHGGAGVLGACSALDRNAMETPVASSTPAVQPFENKTDRLPASLPGGVPPDPLDAADQVLPRALPVARAIQAAFEAWQRGRGLPVDRAALQDSGAVSGTFLDRVAALAAETSGDARALLERLEGGALKGWRQAATLALREHLEEQGYLATEAPLAPADLRVHVLAAVADDLRTGRLPRERLDQVLAAVGA